MKLSTLEAVRDAMLTKLAGSLLTKEDAVKLKFKPLTADQVKTLDVPAIAPGFVLPYFSLDGKPSKFWRLRYLGETRKGFDIAGGRKALRYVQPVGGINEVYLAPFVDWRKLAENTAVPLIITEGELKSACSTKCGLPAIGLGGVWSFKSNKNKVSLLPILKQFSWTGRKVVICYDSDAISNAMVIMAENALARTLTDEGAEVFVARLPTAENGSKVGLDDYLLTHTPEDLLELLHKASSYGKSHALHAMNERVVYVRNPGLVYDYKNKMRMRSQDFTSHSFSNCWHDELVGEKVVQKPTAVAWLNWAHRSELERITFKPGADLVTEDRMLNLWEGWPVEPKKGPVLMWKRLLDHLFEGADAAARTWFEQWCAYPIQNPGKKMTSAAVLWGRVHGTGKTMIGLTLMKLYGQYSAEVTDDEIEDKRREWAENKQFVLADDITGADNRKLSNKLKTMISQTELKLDKKFVPRYSVPDCINYYFTSNAPDVFYLEDTDRRYFIHEVISDVIDPEFKDEYVAWRDSEEGKSALMHYLLTLSLDGFDPYGPAFVTESKRDMENITRSDVGAWVADLRNNTDRILKMPGDLFTSGELLLMYDPMKSTKVTANGMARELKRGGFNAPGVSGSMVATRMGNVRLYAIKNQQFWRKQKAKVIIEHYEGNRSMEPVVKKPGKVKF